MYEIQIHTKYNELQSCIRSQAHLLVESRMDDFSVIWGFIGRSESGVVIVGADFSRSSSSSTNVGLAAVDPIWKPSKMVAKMGIKSVSTTTSSQVNSMSSRSDTSYPLVSVSCAPTLESTSSLISTAPCWLGVMGTRGKGLSRPFGLWDSNKKKAASGSSRELIVSFLVISFAPKTTE